MPFRVLAVNPVAGGACFELCDGCDQRVALMLFAVSRGSRPIDAHETL
jgi:hypothetical protein